MARSTDDVQINTEFYPVSYSLQDSRRPTLYIPELWATRKNGWKGHMYADLKGFISTRRRKRRKGTHEKNGSAAGSVLQSSLEAAVVSAVTTSVHCSEMNGKILTMFDLGKNYRPVR